MVKIKLETDFPGHYSTIEASKLLDIGYATLYRWIKKGKIEATRVGGRTLISNKEIQRLTPYNIEGRNEQNKNRIDF